jgi:hypothetical protein
MTFVMAHFTWAIQAAGADVKDMHVALYGASASK